MDCGTSLCKRLSGCSCCFGIHQRKDKNFLIFLKNINIENDNTVQRYNGKENQQYRVQSRYGKHVRVHTGNRMYR